MTTFHMGLTLSHGMKMYIITWDAILYKAQYICTQHGVFICS